MSIPKTAGESKQTIQNIFTSGFTTLAIVISANTTYGYNYDYYESGHFPIMLPVAAIRQDIQTNFYLTVSNISLIIGINVNVNATKLSVYVGSAHSVDGKVKIYGMK